MKIKYQCSNCGQEFVTLARIGVPHGMYASGIRAVGDAVYCGDCVRSWKERNGGSFDEQYGRENAKRMFIRWWNHEVEQQAKEEKKEVKKYYRLPTGDYVVKGEWTNNDFGYTWSELE